MELSEILDSLSGSSTKTASDNTQNAPSSLSAAIDRALNSEGMDKEASDSSLPADDLMKIAQDLSNAEQDALIKEAHIYGRAVADGFAARMSEYNSSPSSSANGMSNSSTVKEAMELGYLHASTAIANAGLNNSNQEKVANYTGNSYMEKIAQEHQVKEAAYEKGSEDAVKIANFLNGEQDAIKVATELTKVAHQYRDFGYRVGNSILSKLG